MKNINLLAVLVCTATTPMALAVVYSFLEPLELWSSPEWMSTHLPFWTFAFAVCWAGGVGTIASIATFLFQLPRRRDWKVPGLRDERRMMRVTSLLSLGVGLFISGIGTCLVSGNVPYYIPENVFAVVESASSGCKSSFHGPGPEWICTGSELHEWHTEHVKEARVINARLVGVTGDSHIVGVTVGLRWKTSEYTVPYPTAQELTGQFPSGITEEGLVNLAQEAFQETLLQLRPPEDLLPKPFFQVSLPQLPPTREEIEKAFQPRLLWKLSGVLVDGEEIRLSSW